jgi:cysteinyl-tRNA synthetase
VDDLLRRGFQPRHIRFFLLNGPYREDLDLRISRLEAGAGRLDRVRRLLAQLHERRTPDAPSPDPDPAQGLCDDFERAMNDDLDFAGAFGAVTRWLERAAEVDRADGLPPKSRAALQQTLKAIDQVLGVIGP